MNEQQTLFKVRDLRKKDQFKVDDLYLNGYARICGTNATLVYISLCRHAEFHSQKAFPSQKKIAWEHGISARTVRRGLKELIKYNIVKVEQEKMKGEFMNNIYILLDKSEWIKPTEGQSSPTVHPVHRRTEPVGQLPHTMPVLQKDNKEQRIQKTKDNKYYISPTEIEKSLPSYGREDINTIYGFLKDKLGGSPDGSQVENRRFAKLLLDRFKKDYSNKNPVELVKFLIEAGLKDSFHGKNMTNFKYLYYNAQKIIQSIKGRINQVAIITTK